MYVYLNSSFYTTCKSHIHKLIGIDIKYNYYYTMDHKVINYFRLYLGNLPTNITSNAVKDEFPKATRVDIGFAKKMKYTR